MENMVTFATGTTPVRRPEIFQANDADGIVYMDIGS